MRAKVGWLELRIYFLIWTWANVYTLYKLYEAQTEVLQINPYEESKFDDLETGWQFLSRLKDISDIEWSSWKYFFYTSGPFLFVQAIVNEVIRRTTFPFLKLWYIISSVIFVGFYMGHKQLMIVLIQPILYTLLILCGGKKIAIWALSVVLLISYNSIKYKSIFWSYLDRDDIYDEEVYLILFCVAWIELRCISFSVDYVQSVKRHNPGMLETIINMFSYVLYMPLLYTGPIILYQDFEKSFTTNKNVQLKLRPFLWDMFLFTLYSFVMDLSLHYIYFYALQSDMELLNKLPSLALCGGGLWMGLQFHMKYVIAYGITGAFARLDNIDPPPTPRCIARIHVYSEMWRFFDVGLYKFLVKYIHKPCTELLSSHLKVSKTPLKLISSFLTFTFIFLWHGTIKRIFIWAFFNYIGITLECAGKAISESEKYKRFKISVLKTEAMESRFRALLCVPLLTLSAISNFYLFAGNNVGDLFFTSVMNPSFWNSVIIGTALYCCCQVSMALEDVGSRTDVKKRTKVL